MSVIQVQNTKENKMASFFVSMSTLVLCQRCCRWQFKRTNRIRGSLPMRLNWSDQSGDPKHLKKPTTLQKRALHLIDSTV